MSAGRPLSVRREGPLLGLELNRPERRNAFDPALIAALTGAFRALADARVVVLTGAGPSFSAGADLDWMAAAADLDADDNLADVLALQELLETVDGCPVPVVAAVQGHAMGGALGLLACCDVVLADPGARFAFSEVRLGLVPAVVSPYVLARIGSGAARRLFVTGERFDAATALRIGLVDELVDDLGAGVERVIAEILAGAPEATREAKRLARSPLPADECARVLASRRTSTEGQEGVRAFAAGQPPPWARPPG